MSKLSEAKDSKPNASIIQDASSSHTGRNPKSFTQWSYILVKRK